MNILYLILGGGIILKYIAYQQNIQIAINILLVGSLIYFWYLPKEERKKKEDIATDELIKEYDIIKSFEHDVGSNVSINTIKELLAHLSEMDNDTSKEQIDRTADIIENIRDSLKSMSLSIENNNRLKEFTDISTQLMTTLTKRYVDTIYTYNKKEPYFPIDFDQPTPIHNINSINNIFLPLLKNKSHIDI